LPADDEVIILAAGDGVIASVAVDREIDLAGIERGGVDRVVAGAAVDDKRVIAGLDAVDGHLRPQAVDEDRCAAGRDADAVAGRRAVDGHGVRLTIALTGSRRRRQVDGDLRHVGAG
jgi:hypothetical protein